MPKRTNQKARTTPTNFSNIQNANELILYLDDCNSRLRNTDYIHHYTSVSRLEDIIRKREWYLANAEYMNDRLEYEHGDNKRWRNLFFSCFMCEEDESIGMWSMYAQPWEKGVKISFPRVAVKNWLKETKEIHTVSENNNEQTLKIGSDNQLWLSSVAYCNSDSIRDEENGKKSEEKITWSNASNTNIKNAVGIPKLTGYVKDMAWRYEKEIRIKAELGMHDGGIKGVKIEMTDELIEAAKITTSPLFEGDLAKILKEKTGITDEIKIRKSLFEKKLRIKTICQECELKRKYGNMLV